MINVGFIGTDLNVNQKIMKRKLKDILEFGILQPNYSSNFKFVSNPKDNLGEIAEILRNDFKNIYNINAYKLNNENVYNTILNISDIIVIYEDDKNKLLHKLKALSEEVILVIINTKTYGFVTKKINEL